MDPILQGHADRACHRLFRAAITTGVLALAWLLISFQPAVAAYRGGFVAGYGLITFIISIATCRRAGADFIAALGEILPIHKVDGGVFRTLLLGQSSYHWWLWLSLGLSIGLGAAAYITYAKFPVGVGNFIAGTLLLAQACAIFICAGAISMLFWQGKRQPQ